MIKLKWRYRVYSSFGGRMTGMFTRKDHAMKHARVRSRQYPVDLWTTGGGLFGIGRVIMHFNEGKGELIGTRA